MNRNIHEINKLVEFLGNKTIVKFNAALSFEGYRLLIRDIKNNIIAIDFNNDGTLRRN